jgi:hypothetical protein
MVYCRERFSFFTVALMQMYTVSQTMVYPPAKMAVKIPSTAGSKGIQELMR